MAYEQEYLVSSTTSQAAKQPERLWPNPRSLTAHQMTNSNEVCILNIIKFKLKHT
jgi:hypothetical protein